MSYRIEFEKRATQQLGKLDPPICKKVMKRIRSLVEDPRRYPLLSGGLSGLRKISVRTPGGEYRIVYIVDEELKAVNIIFAGSRENFYKELQRYLG